MTLIDDNTMRFKLSAGHTNVQGVLLLCNQLAQMGHLLLRQLPLCGTLIALLFPVRCPATGPAKPATKPSAPHGRSLLRLGCQGSLALLSLHLRHAA